MLGLDPSTYQKLHANEHRKRQSLRIALQEGGISKSK
jgi:hypothetical protein